MSVPPLSGTTQTPASITMATAQQQQPKERLDTMSEFIQQLQSAQPSVAPQIVTLFDYPFVAPLSLPLPLPSFFVGDPATVTKSKARNDGRLRNTGMTTLESYFPLESVNHRTHKTQTVEYRSPTTNATFTIRRGILEWRPVPAIVASALDIRGADIAGCCATDAVGGRIAPRGAFVVVKREHDSKWRIAATLFKRGDDGKTDLEIDPVDVEAHVRAICEEDSSRSMAKKARLVSPTASASTPTPIATVVAATPPPRLPSIAANTLATSAIRPTAIFNQNDNVPVSPMPISTATAGAVAAAPITPVPNPATMTASETNNN